MKQRRTSQPKPTPDDLLLKNLGIIAQRSLYYWRMLPADVRAYYDAEDMISEAVVQVVTALRRYRKNRSCPTTFIWYVASNECKEILQRYSAQKRTALSTTSFSTGFDLPAPSKARLLEAKDSVQALIAHGSDDARQFLEEVFCHGRRRVPSQEVIEELRKSVTRTDLVLVFRYLVA